jgi:hypothetical protein
MTDRWRMSPKKSVCTQTISWSVVKNIKGRQKGSNYQPLSQASEGIQEVSLTGLLL